ncbi:MAG: antibiotic biosynthesis monooxygenase [Candidatus Acidiferrum sp.]
MYARKASLCLKAEFVSKFLQKVEHEVVPLFRKQRGFLDHLIIVPDRGNVVYVYSFWEKGEDAEKYDRTTVPMLNRLLAGVVDGALSVHLFGGLRGRLSGG